MRNNAAWALGNIGGTRAVEALEEASKEEDVGAFVESALEQIKD